MARTTTVSVSEIGADDRRIAGWWISEDRQGSLDMSGMPVSEAVAELLAQCGTDAERAGILAGRIEIIEE